MLPFVFKAFQLALLHRGSGDLRPVSQRIGARGVTTVVSRASVGGRRVAVFVVHSRDRPELPTSSVSLHPFAGGGPIVHSHDHNYAALTRLFLTRSPPMKSTRFPPR